MDIILFLKTCLLGIVQGITEWLPVSSTGHLILVDQFLNLGMDKEFMDVFDVVIQFGSILAVIVIYFHKLNPFSPKKTGFEKTQTFQLWAKAIVATLPAAVIGLLCDDFIDAHCKTPFVIAAALIIYGVLFILVENRGTQPKFDNLDTLPYKIAVLIGCFQVLSLIPGTSRSGSTILGAIILGTSRYVAAEFSFFMAIPVMFGASALKLLKAGAAFGSAEIAVLLVGMVTAFLVSIVAIKLLMGYIRKHDFKVFGYYRIVLGILVILYFSIFA